MTSSQNLLSILIHLGVLTHLTNRVYLTHRRCHMCLYLHKETHDRSRRFPGAIHPPSLTRPTNQAMSRSLGFLRSGQSIPSPIFNRCSIGSVSGGGVGATNFGSDVFHYPEDTTDEGGLRCVKRMKSRRREEERERERGGTDGRKTPNLGLGDV